MEAHLTGLSRPPLSCGKPRYLVVLIHDFGSSAEEIIELSMEWAPVLNKAEFFAPEIPWRPIAGKVSGEPGSRPIHTEVLTDLSTHLQVFLQSISARKRLEHSRIALVGFGHGALLAITAGLGTEDPLGAMVAIGNGLNQVPEPAIRNGKKPPAFLVTADIGPQSPAHDWTDIRSWLLGFGSEVNELTARGDYFGLDDQGLAEIAAYLRAHLAKTEPDSCD